MAITDRMIDQAFSDLKGTCGGLREDYFGLLYLEREFGLAHTFVVSDGEIDKMSRMREVFESDKTYEAVFHPGRLKADGRKIVLCYKVQFRLRKLVNEILEKGERKYWYMNKARNLLWALLCQQRLLNAPSRTSELSSTSCTSTLLDLTERGRRRWPKITSFLMA